MTDHPDPIDVAVGANLRTLRLRGGLSQERLADGVHVTFQQIQKYERGTNRISASMLVHIARVLDVPIAALFFGVDLPGMEAAAAGEELVRCREGNAVLMAAITEAQETLARAVAS